MKWTEAYEEVGNIISVPAKVAKAIGHKNAFLVSQLVHWKGKERTEGGWIYKTKEELKDETALSIKEQRHCVDELKSLGVLETRYERLEHRLYYRVCTEALDAIMAQVNFKDSPGQVPKGQMPNSPAQKADGTCPKGRSPSDQKAARHIDQRIRQEKTQETTKTKEVDVAFFVSEEEKKFRDWMEVLRKDFGLSKSQVRRVKSYVPDPGEEYIREKEELTRSEPRDNLGGFFMSALAEDYQPRVSTKGVKKEKKAGETQQEFAEMTDEEWEKNKRLAKKMKKTVEGEGGP